MDMENNALYFSALYKCLLAYLLPSPFINMNARHHVKDLF